MRHMQQILRIHRLYTFQRNIILGAAGIAGIFMLSIIVPNVSAGSSSVVTIHADNEEYVVTTEADTVEGVIAHSEIELGENDVVEPGLDTEITSQSFNVNVYRARPTVIVDEDEDEKYRVETARTSPRLIAEEAEEVEVHEKDKLDLELVTDFLRSEYVGHKVIIDRATPVNVTLANKETVIRTHASTVKDMFKEADIKINENDIVKPGLDRAIKEKMDVSLTRVGFKTITKEERIDPPTETIQDNDRPLGYEEVEEKGKPGLVLVTYEVKYKNGEVVNRNRIRKIVEEKPEPRVVVMGRRFSQEEAFAELRFCESGGDYSAVNPIGYYGAYQFNQSTWDSYAPPEYRGQRPDTVEPSVQDQVALELYNTRGWQPWPKCGASLP